MRRVLIIGSALLASSAAHSASYICKQAGSNWEELSFHVLGSIEYVVVGPPGKQYEIGKHGLFSVQTMDCPQQSILSVILFVSFLLLTCMFPISCQP